MTKREGCFAPVAASAKVPAARLRSRVALSRDDVVMRAGVVALAGVLLLIVGLPLWSLLAKGFEDKTGAYVGLANYVTYFSTPALFDSALNSLHVAAAATLIVVPLAFLYAYALTRAVLPLRWLFQGISLIPIFAPSLLPGLALIYLFGNQGFFKGVLGGPIYGFDGILIAQVFYCFPHATLILVTALATADARLYEAADVLGASRVRVFFTVTLPGAKYGLISAALVVFTLVITDFGIAKVIGGNFNVLATDVYKQVIGQQNFSMGAVVGMVLLAPAALAFVVDRVVQRKQVALLTARAVPLVPRPKTGRDMLFTAYCTVVSIGILAILGMAAWGSLIKYWPYNLSLTLDNYEFSNFDANGWMSYFNSLEMAVLAAVGGTTLMFVGAWLNERTRDFFIMRGIVQFLAFLPMAVPGLVLGLGYIFFFNAPGNPLNFLYATMGILAINCVAHFYTVGHLTATTALKQIDPEFESVSASLKVPVWRTFSRVTAPICLPAILDIAIYLFVNAMTTVSSVIFLYAPDTKLASVAAVNIEETGATAAAAALCIVIVVTSAAVKALHLLADRYLLGRLQAWRRR
ncbi:MAG: putative 2-aminoethylphosphonate ABC transporter permease subunit [Reyranella sp.]|uniref:putative 2-aminoethylphosphonate ABC transporter permease subunit n=1 Tax=Reyranella sp. TaxID=1929291 RepID=UPI003D152E2E